MTFAFIPARAKSSPLATSGLAISGLAVLCGFNLGLAVLCGPHPPVAEAAAPTLSFQMTARFASKDSDGSSSPSQTVDAKVYVQGRRVRAESHLSDRLMVLLFSPPYAYRLLPSSKTGLRYHVGDMSNSEFDPQTLLRDPSAIRSALQREGAHLVQKAVLNGEPVDVYQASRFMGRTQQVKAWLRRSDALPVHLELSSRTLSVTATWRNYQRPGLDSSFFEVPSGYRIREAQGRLQSM